MSGRLIKIQVKESDQGLRLLKFLANETRLNFNQLQSLLRKKEIKLNGFVTKFDTILSHGDEIKIFLKDENQINHKKQIREKILPKRLVEVIKNSKVYEDDKIICINKPYNIAVQGGTNIKNCITDFFKVLSDQKLYIVHRIDRETRGLLVLAKSLQVAQEITLAFKERKVKKEYIAIVNPSPFKKEGEINLPIFVDEIEKDAKTFYSTIKHYPTENLSILKVIPESGRKHQIRIHLSKINAPIIGDRKYNGNKLISKYLQLFATKIQIPNYPTLELKTDKILDLKNINLLY